MILPTLHLKIERWKFNKDFGVYVSTLGNFKDRHKRRLPIKIGQSGYCYVKVEGPVEWKSAHRIVMLTWKPIPNAEELTVDHLNHNKRDNSLGNLEWVTKAENIERSKQDFIPAIKSANKNKNKKKDFTMFSTKIPLKQYQEAIKGWSINGKFCQGFDDIIEAVLKYYPGGYPHGVIRKAMDDMLTRKNMSGVKKFGKKVTLRVVFKEEQ